MNAAASSRGRGATCEGLPDNWTRIVKQKKTPNETRKPDTPDPAEMHLLKEPRCREIPGAHYNETPQSPIAATQRGGETRICVTVSTAPSTLRGGSRRRKPRLSTKHKFATWGCPRQWRRHAAKRQKCLIMHQTAVADRVWQDEVRRERTIQKRSVTEYQQLKAQERFERRMKELTCASRKAKTKPFLESGQCQRPRPCSTKNAAAPIAPRIATESGAGVNKHGGGAEDEAEESRSGGSGARADPEAERENLENQKSWVERPGAVEADV